MAAAAFALRAAIVAPMASLADAFEAGAEPGTGLGLREATRLAAGARKLAAAAGTREREAATEREAQLRGERAAAEQAAERAESRLQGLEPLSEALAHLARGDLRTRFSDARQVHPLAARLDQTVELFAKTMLAFSASLGAIRRGAVDMNAAVDAYGDEISKWAARTETATRALAKGSDSAAELTAPLSESAALLKALIEEASRHAAHVQQGGRRLGEIRQTAKRIEPILELVDEVAFQTNLLALNAGVEAARVGEAGRGFAVVAQELRVLSQRATEAAKESSGLLSRVLAEAERGAAELSAPAAAYTAFAECAAKIVGVLEQTGIKWADRKGADEAVRALSESVAEASAARDLLSAEITEETESLEGLLGKLSALLDRFSFPSDDAPRFRAPSQRLGASANDGVREREPRGLPSPARGRAPRGQRFQNNS